MVGEGGDRSSACASAAAHATLETRPNDQTASPMTLPSAISVPMTRTSSTVAPTLVMPLVPAPVILASTTIAFHPA